MRCKRSVELLDLSQLQRVDNFAAGEGIGNHDQPGAGKAPTVLFQGGERVDNRSLGIVRKLHFERFNAPG